MNFPLCFHFIHFVLKACEPDFRQRKPLFVRFFISCHLFVLQCDKRKDGKWRCASREYVTVRSNVTRPFTWRAFASYGTNSRCFVLERNEDESDMFFITHDRNNLSFSDFRLLSAPISSTWLTLNQRKVFIVARKKSTNSPIAWDIMPFCLQGKLSLLASSFTMVSCFAYSSTLKMKVTCSSETSVNFQRTTWHYTEPPL
jgi:hypothetical protein